MLFTEIALTNFLSFGSDKVTVPLRNLNVLIGPNGSGKSNFIEAIVVLRACAKDIQKVLRTGGGVTEWVWKGDPRSTTSINAVVNDPEDNKLRHLMLFESEKQRFAIRGEVISGVTDTDQIGTVAYHFNNRVEGASLAIKGRPVRLRDDEFNYNDSILAQRRDPVQFPEVTFLATQYEKISVYREWMFGKGSNLREPQRTDERIDRLEENFSNLAMFLNRLRGIPATKRAIISALRDIYEEVKDFDVHVEGGTVQIFLEEGDYTIPAIRLSDGTLRYLCLLAILCDPTPPPLICIEEPELGLHMDLLPKLAKLLVEASERTQLVVTTHSDILVDALSDCPETILVCEKHEGKTQINRLSSDGLADWLKNYRLGELWMKGVLGGTRW